MNLPVTFAVACSLIAIWAVTGPLFHFSDTWQLVINTGTTVITFLMAERLRNLGKFTFADVAANSNGTVEWASAATSGEPHQDEGVR